MKILRFTLVAEGPSDRVLIPILRWMLFRHHQHIEWMGQFADLRDLPKPPRTLPKKSRQHLSYSPQISSSFTGIQTERYLQTEGKKSPMPSNHCR